MTKKTERPRKYAKLTETLSLKLSIRANKQSENWLNVLADPRAVLTVILRP